MYSIVELSPDEFPAPLREIPQPPKKLFRIGELPDIKTHTYLAVVGSRNHTSYGKDALKSLIKGLAGYPVVIVSGLAIGIDTLAHQTAMECNLPTVAVPGSGLDKKVLYPKQNMHLAERIIENGGCLLSEYPSNIVAAPWTFPQRNRIMAGLCKAVLIIEAEEKSGTLITARLATDYNRDVLVVPGSIFSPASRGTNQFLRLGATPITSVADLLEALGFTPPEEEATVSETLFATLSENEQIILALLTEAMTRDDLIETSGMSTVEVSTVLMTLEIKGLITEEYGEIRRTK